MLIVYLDTSFYVDLDRAPADKAAYVADERSSDTASETIDPDTIEVDYLPGPKAARPGRGPCCSIGTCAC